MLERLNVMINYQLTIEEAAELNRLIESRVPMKGIFSSETKNKCPLCGFSFFYTDKFCPTCGQRVEFTHKEELDYVPFEDMPEEGVLK